jgi:hypothetical protein
VTANTKKAKVGDKASSATAPTGDKEGNTAANYNFLPEHVEYRESINLWIQWARFRRQGLLFASAAHAAVIAANTSSAVFQGAPSWLLPLIGVGMALVGLLNEVFLFNEMMNFKRRAVELEATVGYSLISAHKRSLSGPWQFATANLFRLYHFVWLIGFAIQLFLVIRGAQ